MVRWLSDTSLTVLYTAAVAGAVLTFLVIAWHTVVAPIDRLVQILPDDAFYYLEIANNLEDTGRSTADGFAPTNGFHPLWMAICVALAWFTEDPIVLVRLAVAASFVLHACAALMFTRCMVLMGHATWGWPAALCYLFNPLAVNIALHAVESSVYALLIFSVLAVHLRIVPLAHRSHESADTRRLAIYGAVLGAACLARTEAILVSGLACAWLAVASARWSGALAVRRTVVVVSAMAAVGLPWVLFSLWQVGHVVQDSGAMKALWASDMYPSIGDRVRNVGYMASFFVLRTVQEMIPWDVPLVAIAVALAAATLTVLVVRLTSGLVPHATTLHVLRAAASVLVMLVLIYGVTLVDRQIWWLTLPSVAIVVLGMTGAAFVLTAWRVSVQRQRGVGRALVLSSVLAAWSWHGEFQPLYPWQLDVLRSQQRIDAIVPPGARIGAFNAGIPMYFGEAPVVALDGLVNHEARQAWSDRRFETLLTQFNVRFVADEPWAWRRALRFSRVPPILDPLLRFRLRGTEATSERILWRVVSPQVKPWSRRRY